MQIINIKDRTPEWKEWRKNGIGSSDIAAIVNKSPFKSAYKVFEEKKGLVDSDFMNLAMSRGVEQEPVARQAFNKYMNAEFTPINLQHDVYPFFRASLDGYSNATGEIVELKVPSDKNFDSYDGGNVPEHYYIQIQWQLYVSDLSVGYLSVWNPERKQQFVIKVQACHETQKFLEQEGLLFWDNLKNDIAPPLQAKDYLYIKDSTLDELAEEYAMIAQQKKELEDRLKKIKPLIYDHGDGGNFKTDRLTVFLKNTAGTLDQKKMIEDGIDIAKYRKPGTTFYTIRLN